MNASYQPNDAILDSAFTPEQSLADTGAADALAGVGKEQRAVCCALNKPAGAIEELISYPFQSDAAMRAAIDKHLSSLALANHEQRFASVQQAATAGVRNIVQQAQRDGGRQGRFGHARIIRGLAVLCQDEASLPSGLGPRPPAAGSA